MNKAERMPWMRTPEDDETLDEVIARISELPEHAIADNVWIVPGAFIHM